MSLKYVPANKHGIITTLPRRAYFSSIQRCKYTPPLYPITFVMMEGTHHKYHCYFYRHDNLGNFLSVIMYMEIFNTSTFLSLNVVPEMH